MRAGAAFPRRLSSLRINFARITMASWSDTPVRNASVQKLQMQDNQVHSVQDLKSFRLPPNFRGRSGLMVQLWWLVQATLFRGSPQIMYGFRRWLLRRFGARIGKGVIIRPTVPIPFP